jgi:hypothetical protein
VDLDNQNKKTFIADHGKNNFEWISVPIEFLGKWDEIESSTQVRFCKKLLGTGGEYKIKPKKNP